MAHDRVVEHTDKKACKEEFCSKNLMCPELQPILSQCQNKKEGSCDCKLFCKQQMNLLKSFIVNKKKFKLRDAHSKHKDNSQPISYEREKQEELQSYGETSSEPNAETLKQTVLKDIDLLCGLMDQNAIFKGADIIS